MSLQSHLYDRLRRHCDRGGSQWPDRGDGHGPWGPAGPVPGEEPLHRRHGFDDGVDPWLPLRTGRFHPVPGTEPDLRGSRPGACPIYEPEVQSASISEDGQPPIRSIRIRNVCWSTSARRSGSRRCWGWPRWRRGPRPRPAPSAASTCARRRSHWTKCGRAPPTRRSAKPSGPPCSAASWMWSTAFSLTGPSTPRFAACWPSSPSTRPTAVPFLRGAPSASPSPWPRRERRRCRRCGAVSAPSPITWPGCSSSTAASSGATPRCHASSSRAAR